MVTMVGVNGSDYVLTFGGPNTRGLGAKLTVNVGFVIFRPCPSLLLFRHDILILLQGCELTCRLALNACPVSA
jgi:hypothetical protein